MVLRWSSSADLPLDTDRSIAPLGTDGRDFVLNADVLWPGAEVIFSLEVTVFDDALQESVTGLATVEVKVNFPPSSGTCAVEPQSGLALQTQFAVVCSGWKDDISTDLFYEYIALVPVSDDESAGVTIFTNEGGGVAGFDGFAQTTLFPRSSRKTELKGVKMPLPTDGATAYEATILVRISDESGAFTDKKMLISVTDPFAGLTAAEQDAIIQQEFEDNVVVALQKGDSSTALSSISNIAVASTREERTTGRRYWNSPTD
jgi:hypothetical protein